MFYMRVLLAVAVIALGIAGAGAADLDTGRELFRNRLSQRAAGDLRRPARRVRARLLAGALGPSTLFPGHRQAAADRTPRKSCGRQPPVEAGANVPALLVERVGLRARTAARRPRRQQDARYSSRCRVAIHGPDPMSIRLSRKGHGIESQRGRGVIFSES